MELDHNQLDEWLEENKDRFVPPICNKLMHQQSQLKVMYVGGPNKRKDYHLEEGEEFFYMLKGDMCLKVVEHAKLKDVIIKEGQVFLLPGRTLHSPNREANSLGLVIERERLAHENDCLRYFVDGSTETLFEKWFFCDDLGSRLGPIVKAFFDSEQYRTGKPIPGSITSDPPFVTDQNLTLMEPFNLKDWITDNREDIDSENGKSLFSAKLKSEVRVYGKGKHSQKASEVSEIFLLTLFGEGQLRVGNELFNMKKGSSHLVRKGSSYQLDGNEDSATLSVVMNPR